MKFRQQYVLPIALLKEVNADSKIRKVCVLGIFENMFNDLTVNLEKKLLSNELSSVSGISVEISIDEQ